MKGNWLHEVVKVWKKTKAKKNKQTYMIIFLRTAKVRRINLQRMDGSFSAAPDCIASQIYPTKRDNTKEKIINNLIM